MDDLISRQAAKSKKVYSSERHEYVVPVAELDWLPSEQEISEEIRAAYEQGRIQGHVEMRTALLKVLKEVVGDEVWANI